MNELPAGLTAEQVEVLRLVQQNLSSKEIARLLGISKSAIDQRLDRARQVLGASSRREAARIYAGLEQGYDRITRDPAALVYPAPATAFPSAADRNDMPVQRVQATRSAFDMDPGVGHVSLRQLLKGVRPHDLSTAQRFILTLLVAIGVPMLLGGLSMLLYGVVAIGRLFLRQPSPKPNVATTCAGPAARGKENACPTSRISTPSPSWPRPPSPASRLRTPHCATWRTW